MRSGGLDGLNLRSLVVFLFGYSLQHIQSPALLTLFVVEVDVGVAARFFEPDIV